MGYEFDVFISYKHGKLFGNWVHEHFYDIFKDCLNQSLGRESRIFLDKNDIYSGDEWPERIRKSLALSKCQIGIWSPHYFNSSYGGF